jgi:exosortase/archaeosortase family protein
MNKLLGNQKNTFFLSKINTIYRQYFLFILKLTLLNLPLFIAFKLLRSNPNIQTTVSETFPVYHLAKLIMTSAQALLSMIGYNASLVYDTTIYHYGVFSLQIAGGVQTFIGFSCLGLGVSWVFASLIISSQGRAIAKTIYVILGILIIFVMNVIRMSFLTWSGRDGLLFTNKTISFFGIAKIDHHDLFNIFIYIVIFLLFILWVEVFSKKKSHK